MERGIGVGVGRSGLIVGILSLIFTYEMILRLHASKTLDFGE